MVCARIKRPRKRAVREMPSGQTDARTHAEEKVAHLLEEDEPTRALLAVMLKRSGMDQMKAELVLRKAGWWLT